MSQRLLIILFLIIGFLSFMYFTHTTPRQADLLLTNATVYTLDPEKPTVQEVAIHNGRIVATGMRGELLGEYQARRIIDLKGKTVVPGLTDGHAHMNGLGELLQSINLVGIGSRAEVVAVVHKRANEMSPGQWIYGRGWDQNLWEGGQFPTAQALDEAAPRNPVILGRIDGHAVWVNSRAMEIAGISLSTPDPQGGRIIRDAGGNATGIFIDKAKPLIEDFFPPQSPDELERSILLASQACVRMGLTEVHDMNDSLEIDVYKKLIGENKLPLRIYAALDGTSSPWMSGKFSRPITGFGNDAKHPSDMLTVRAMKLYMDGALGSRGAALFEEYNDDPGNRGVTYMGEKELEVAVMASAQKGFQACVHAIGDRANHIVLNVYERVLKAMPAGDYRFRIEHVQVLSRDDIRRFKELAVLPSMQPVHCTSDMYWAEARLGPERVKGAYAWRSILDTGTPIIAGSDFPNDDMSPLHGFYAAITRSDKSGYPADGWHGHQKMTREEALKSYTLWPAYGAFQEETKGSIQYGKYADFTVLSKDIMTIPPEEVLQTEIEMTIVGGRIVYAKPPEPTPS